MSRKWYDGRLVNVVDHNTTTKSFWIEIDGIKAFDYKPGQFITLDLPIHDKRHKRWRSYSIANLPAKDGLIELCIVSLEHGLASRYLFHDIKVGNTIRFKGPDGNFTLSDEMLDKELIMVCTGTGVAPFRSMLLDLQERGLFQNPVHLIFGTRRQKDILYYDEFVELALKQPHFKYTVTLSRDEDWLGDKGYVHQVYQQQYPVVKEDRLFLLCGWSRMIDEAVEILLLKLGYGKSQVRYELYG